MSDIKEVITLISDKKITRFNEIFKHVTKKTMSEGSKVKYARIKKIAINPGACRYHEIVSLSTALNVNPLEILKLLKNEFDFQKA